jgi:hypothetical protein
VSNFKNYFFVILIASLSLAHATTPENSNEEIQAGINKSLEQIQAILEENIPNISKLKAIHELLQIIEDLETNTKHKKNLERDAFYDACYDMEQRETYIMKLFKDNNLPADVELAKRLAVATEKYKCSYTPDSEKYIHPMRQIKAWKDHSYSNRDLEYIVMAAKERKFNDYVMNQKDCTKTLCAYFADVMSRMGKTGKEAKGKRVINCD